MFERIILNLIVLSGIIGFLYLTFLYAKARYLAHCNLKRSLNMVFLKVQMAKKESKEEQDQEQSSGTKDFKEAIGIMSQMFDSLHSIYSGDWKNKFTGEDFLSLEYVVQQDQIYFYLVVPFDLISLIEKQITGLFPDAYVEQVEEYNIFQPDYHTAAKALTLSKHYMYPIKTFQRLSSDPINNLTNALSKLAFDDGAVIQIMIRPTDGWQKAGREEAKNILNQKPKKKKSIWTNPLKLIAAFFDFMMGNTGGKKSSSSDSPSRTTPMTDEEVKDLEQKNTSKGYETIIRIICSSNDEREVKSNLTNIVSTFAQYASQSANRFSSVKRYPKEKIIEDYILRRFSYPWFQKFKKKLTILSTEELASIFHFPNTRFNKTPGIHWQNFKIAPAPKNMPKEGLLLGHNHYRGITTEVRMKREDRFRHFYVIGQTGTGKSSIFQIMARQDLRNNDGLAVIDPHGSLIEDLLPFVPRNRADDVIYFNPADQTRLCGTHSGRDTPQYRQRPARCHEDIHRLCAAQSQRRHYPQDEGNRRSVRRTFRRPYYRVTRGILVSLHDDRVRTLVTHGSRLYISATISPRVRAARIVLGVAPDSARQYLDAHTHHFRDDAHVSQSRVHRRYPSGSHHVVGRRQPHTLYERHHCLGAR
jgi:hypothetical protein